eukprot:gene109-4358_t
MKESSPLRATNYKFLHHINTTEKSSDEVNLQNAKTKANGFVELKSNQNNNLSIQKKAKIVSEWMKKTAHVVVFTGNESNWPQPQKKDFKCLTKNSEKKINSMITSKPNFSHYALSTLMKNGYIHHITTTNIDGLHMRSGVPLEKISELNGNIYKFICDECGFEKYRKSAKLGEKILCRQRNCRGEFKSSIMYEKVDEKIEKNSKENASISNVSLIMGDFIKHSSPINFLQNFSVGFKGKLAIVNQKTTCYDKYSHLKIDSSSEELLSLILKELNLPMEDDFDLLQKENSFLEEDTAQAKRLDCCRLSLQGVLFK